MPHLSLSYRSVRTAPLGYLVTFLVFLIAMTVVAPSTMAQQPIRQQLSFSTVEDLPRGNPTQTLGTNLTGEFFSMELKYEGSCLPNSMHFYHLVLREFQNDSYAPSAITRDFFSTTVKPSSQCGVRTDLWTAADFDTSLTFDPTKFYAFMLYQLDAKPLGSASDIFPNGCYDTLAELQALTCQQPTNLRDLYFVLKVKLLREPVIIVPGIMGSRLNRVTDDAEVWPNVFTMFLGSNFDNYLDELKLTSDAQEVTGHKMNVTSIIDEESLLITRVFYKNLIDRFTGDGYQHGIDLFVFPYDWRFGVQSAAVAFDDVVRRAKEKSSNGKVNIIAHSMGGLLVKNYLSHLPDTSFINKLVLVGVPQLGSPKTFKLLNWGDDLDMDWFVFGLNPDKSKEISQNMPSVYQLLPSKRYVNVAGSYVKDFRNGNVRLFDYDQTSQFMISNSNDSRNESLLISGDLFHSNLDVKPFNAPTVHNIVGCFSPTISEFALYDNDVVDVRRDSGDETVPLVSAMNLTNDFNNYFVLGNETGVGHMKLVSDSRPLSLIKRIVDGTESSTPLPQGVSSAVADCFTARSQFRNETTIEFSTHSPVELHVFDSQNRHTGPLANGRVELGISGSRYEKIGENAFVLVPGGDNYKVIDQALRSGTFMMKVKGYVGSNLNHVATYLSVPLQSGNTKAELNFSDFEGDLTLKLDNDGNGTVDYRLSPNAILTDSSQSDITPPAISLPSIPETVVVNRQLTFAFSAMDDLSGIALLNATLDGIPLTTGTTISNLTIGPHMLKVEAIDKAGNPRVELLRFNVIYNFEGFLPPIKVDGSGTYKQGRTLPIKFRLTDTNNQFVSTAVARLFVSKLSEEIIGSEEVVLSALVANEGNVFRYDKTTNQYIFNLNSSTFTSGTWRLRVQLDDGKSYSVDVSLKS